MSKKQVVLQQVVLQFYSLSVPGSIQHYGHCLFGVLMFTSYLSPPKTHVTVEPKKPSSIPQRHAGYHLHAIYFFKRKKGNVYFKKQHPNNQIKWKNLLIYRVDNNCFLFSWSHMEQGQPDYEQND